MPTPDITPGAPCWIDLMTSDTEKAKSFYGALFGWTFETGDEEKYGGYITASKDGKSVAGLMQKMAEQAGFPDVWSTYLRADDAAATAEAVKAHGGQVYMEPMDVPEQGKMAMFADATGASIGVWEPHEMKGFELAAEPGAPAWHELHTKDYARCREVLPGRVRLGHRCYERHPGLPLHHARRGRRRQSRDHGRLRLPAGRGALQLAGLLCRPGRRRHRGEGRRNWARRSSTPPKTRRSAGSPR